MIKKFIIFTLILLIIIFINKIDHNFDKYNYINLNKKYLKYQNKNNILNQNILQEGIIEAKSEILFCGLVKTAKKIY